MLQNEAYFKYSKSLSVVCKYQKYIMKILDYLAISGNSWNLYL